MSRRMEARTKRVAVARIPWRTLLVWGLPVLAFAWLSVASRAAGDSSAVLPSPGAILGGGAVAVGRFQFDGKFKSAAGGSGTGRVRFTFRPDVRGRGYSCDTGAVAWQVRTSTGISGRAKPRAGHAY